MEYFDNEEIQEIQEMVQIAKMYHNEGLTQDKIAKELGISRSTISMFLTEAKKRGIIQVTIKDPLVNNQEIAGEFEKRFDLKKCIVVPGGNIQQEKVILRMAAYQAAKYLVDILSSHMTVGISWGSSCYEIMKVFPEETRLCDMVVVPLIGGSPLLSQEFQINESVRNFAEKLRGIPTLIYSPGMVDSIDDKKRVMESRYMQSIIEKWNNIDMAIVGIGQPPQFYDRSIGSESPGNMLDIVNQYPDSAVGDLCGRRIDINGNFIRCNYNDRIIGIEEESLRKTGDILALAVGGEKIFPIIGALHTHILSYLVMDEATAINILDILDSGAIQSLK